MSILVPPIFLVRYQTISQHILSLIFISIFNQTTNDLQKSITEDLIMTAKLLKDDKDDVNTCKWIKDIEHLLNIAHDSEPSRLGLIFHS